MWAPRGIEATVRLVRLRAEAALLRRLNAGYGFAEARVPAQLFLRDPGARERLGRDDLKPRDTHAAQAAELAEAVAAAEAEVARQPGPLGEVAARFQLGPAEAELLAIACAYELDADVRDLCHGLSAPRRAALHADLAAELSPALADPAALVGALHPCGPLRRAALIEVGPRQPGEAIAAVPLSVDRAVLDWLLGDDRLPEALAGVVRVLPRAAELEVVLDAAVLERAAALGAAWRSGEAAVLLQGPTGAGKLALAHFLARAAGKPLATLSVAAVRAAELAAGAPLLPRALTAALLRDAVVYVQEVEALYAATEGHAVDAALATALEGHPGPLIFASRARGLPRLPIARPFHLVRLGNADLDSRRRAWAHGLATLGEAADPPLTEPRAAEILAGRYVLGPGTISEVVRDARAFARGTGAPATLAAIEDAVARRLTLRLGAFGTLITRRARFDEMVLPEDVIEPLREMIAMVRERSRILESWGYGRHLGLSRGVSALFSGEPGTGKTMAASVISSELGLELVRIDLSAVVSKWVGETEKHLARIFDEAQSANAMLLFDEADSLFGKRTELKSAQDRYANLEVNYILQRMETFDGVSILTTNFENAIDKAFVRRLNFRIRFPRPEVEEREALWRTLLPPETGLADRVDFPLLARRFDMTGGHIRNAIVRAAVIAARHDRPMEPADLLAGAHQEYVELGKVMPSL